MTHNERVLALLADGQPRTHHELYALHVIAHSRVAELRKRGYRIDCWQETRNGERVSMYRLALEDPSGLVDTGGSPSATEEPDPASGMGRNGAATVEAVADMSSAVPDALTLFPAEPRGAYA